MTRASNPIYADTEFEEENEPNHIDNCIDKHGWCRCCCKECVEVYDNGRHSRCICVICRCYSETT